MGGGRYWGKGRGRGKGHGRGKGRHQRQGRSHTDPPDRPAALAFSTEMYNGCQEGWPWDIGTNPQARALGRIMLSGWPTQEQVHEADLVINCTPVNLNYNIETPRQEYYSLNIRYKPGREQRMDEAMSRALYAVHQGKEVLVHCVQGLDRSGSLFVIITIILSFSFCNQNPIPVSGTLNYIIVRIFRDCVAGSADRRDSGAGTECLYGKAF